MPLQICLFLLPMLEYCRFVSAYTSTTSSAFEAISVPVLRWNVAFTVKDKIVRVERSFVLDISVVHL